MRNLLFYVLLLFTSAVVCSQVQIRLVPLKGCLTKDGEINLVYQIENTGDEDVYLWKDNLRFNSELFDESGGKVIGNKVLETLDTNRDKSDYYLLVQSKQTIAYRTTFEIFYKYNLEAGTTYTLKSSYESYLKKGRFKKYKGVKLINELIPINDLSIAMCNEF